MNVSAPAEGLQEPYGTRARVYVCVCVCWEVGEDNMNQSRKRLKIEAVCPQSLPNGVEI